MRKNYTSGYKVSLILEILKEEATLNEIAAREEINPNQLANWKREFMSRVLGVFDEKKQTREQQKAEKDRESEKTQMLKTIGQLTMERDFLKAAQVKLSDRRLL